MISNSGHDERNQYSGGIAGDQGGEWTIRSWYNRPWDCVLRYPSRKVGDLLAKLSRQAAENNNIGYDQNERWTYWEQLKKAGYYPKNIKTKCEADCSSGVLANVKAVGYLLNLALLKNIDPNGWTGSMKQQLTSAGFEVLISPKYRTSDLYLLPGDILLNERSHTAVNLDTGAQASTTTGSGKCRENVMIGQQWLNDYYGHLLERVFGAQLVVDGDYGKKTRAAALCVWKDVCNRIYHCDLDIWSDTFDRGCREAADTVAIVEYGSDGTFPLICKLLLAAYKYYDKRMDTLCGIDLCQSIQKFEIEKNLTVDGIEPLDCAAGREVWGTLFKEV